LTSNYEDFAVEAEDHRSLIAEYFLPPPQAGISLKFPPFCFMVGQFFPGGADAGQ
jgi:hypothetical protein